MVESLTEMSEFSSHNPALGRMGAFLSMEGRLGVVVGGGKVATRRVATLLAAGARVHVIAPIATPEIQKWASGGTITWDQRQFDDADLSDAWFVVTATGSIDAHVSSIAEHQRIWCVNAAEAELGTATTPTTVLGPDGIAIAINGGGDPGRSIALRDAITALMNSGALPLRATRRPASGVGRVTLVGGGPGDPDLVTVRGRQAIAGADVLVVDRLAPAALWANPAPGVEVIDVGKAPGRHAASQDDINATLVRHALAGRNVVRIKGGDSFVLGRGGEEAQACVEAGVPVEIVPGITSAISVPAAAGIPVTHRSITSSFIVASAHEGAAGVLAATSGAAPETTLVLLMGAGKLAEIATALISAGRNPNIPLAVIESGWTNRQRTTVSTLGDAAAANVTAHPPAVVVIGEVVTVRASIGDLGRVSDAAGHS